MSTTSIITHDKCSSFEAEIEKLKTENKELRGALNSLTVKVVKDGESNLSTMEKCLIYANAKNIRAKFKFDEVQS